MTTPSARSQRHGLTPRRALPPGWTIAGTELYQNAHRGTRPAKDTQRLRMLIARARQANLGY